MQPKKRVKGNNNDDDSDKSKFQEILNNIKKANRNNEQHPFQSLMKVVSTQGKHPILHAPQQHGEVYKQNNDRKKKPIEVYLDAVSSIYKKRDLDTLVSPIAYTNPFEEWSPKEIAIFQQAIITFGKQFEMISHVIGSKTHKQVYEFYLEWKGTSHYKSYKASLSANNRNNLQEVV